MQSYLNTPWTQDLNSTYIRRSEYVQRLMYVQFTSCVYGVMIQKKPADEIYLDFPELFIVGK